MRQLFGWVFDPYVHVLLIAVVLVWLSTIGGPAIIDGPGLTHCGVCKDVHDPSEARCLVVKAINGLVGAQE